ncbi:choice-of-anchor D domain-containing protein, partial [Myxococcota bacterium]|nr:choice-of-anchor D domain-containing protein [Myxococcota bacterium]
MSLRRLSAALSLLTVTTGCPVLFKIEHPTRVRQIRPLPVSLDVVGGTGAVDTPIVCVELPIGWPVRTTSFTATTADGRVTGELTVAEAASDTMRTGHARRDHTWTCWQALRARFDERSKGNATLTVSVPSAVGPFDLRYATGSELSGVPQGQILSRRVVVLTLDDHLDEWIASTPPRAFDATFVDVAHGAGRFVAVSSSARVATSDDGLAFEPGDTGVAEPMSTVTFGDGRFAAAGDRVVVTSPDGRTWSVAHRAEAHVAALAWDDRFVGVGAGGLVVRSDEGVAWTSTTTPAARGLELLGVAAGDGRFVAVGSLGTVLHSVDAIEWNAASMVPSIADLRAVAWSGERFVAVGAGGAVLTSVDGDVWSVVTTGSAEELADVTWGAGVFVAVSSGNVGRVLTSSDGVAWTARDVGTQLPLYGVTFGADRWIAVGEAGLVVRAGLPRASQPADLDLGAVPPGGESIAGVIQVDDLGTAKLGLLAIELSGDDAAEFRLVDPNACRGVDVAPGSSCALGVLFRPRSSGAKSAIVTIETNDPARRLISLRVSGLGSAAGLIDVVDPTPPSDDRVVTFVDVPPDTIARHTLTLSNRGDAALVLGSIARVNELEGPLSVGTDACSGTTLTPGASCTLELVFAPTTLGNWTDAFDIPSSDPQEPTAIVEVRATAKHPPIPSC